MPKENDFFYRSLEFKREWLDEEKRTADMSFSSETDEVGRWFGTEILDHSQKAVDLKRLNSIGAHIFNHDPGRIIGPINSAKIENGRGVANVGFDDTDEGNLAFERTKSGSLRGVSLGYRVQVYKELMENEEYQLATRTIKGRKDNPIFIATKWEPIEITSTPIPADSSVGLGRDLTRSLDGITVEKTSQEDIMTEEQIRALIADGIKAGIAEIEAKRVESEKPQLRMEVSTAKDLVNRASAVSQKCEAEAGRMIWNGKTEREVLRFILDQVAIKSDANDLLTPNDDGTGRNTHDTPSNTPGQIRSFKHISDEDFYNTILNPSPIM